MVMIKTFSYNEKDKPLIESFEQIAHRERYRGFSSLIMDVIEKYVKEHGDGNPAFTLDQFQDPKMKAMPAMMRSLPDWKYYIDNLTEKEFRELESQVYAIKSKLDEKWHRQDFD